MRLAQLSVLLSAISLTGCDKVPDVKAAFVEGHSERLVRASLRSNYQTVMSSRRTALECVQQNQKDVTAKGQNDALESRWSVLEKRAVKSFPIDASIAKDDWDLSTSISDGAICPATGIKFEVAQSNFDRSLAQFEQILLRNEKIHGLH